MLKYGCALLFMMVPMLSMASAEMPYRKWLSPRSDIIRDVGKPTYSENIYCNTNDGIKSPTLRCDVDVWIMPTGVVQATYNIENQLVMMQYRNVPYVWSHSNADTIVEPYKDVVNETSREWKRKSLTRIRTLEDWLTF